MSSSFDYTTENKRKLDDILKRYPTKRAAMLPALHLAQEQEGYISPEVEQRVSVARKLSPDKSQARVQSASIALTILSSSLNKFSIIPL